MLTLLMVMLVGLFTVGCGDSGEDFVVTGNNGQVPTGNVTFQFARAQNVATVPTATQKLLFTFFNAAGQSTGTAGTAFANTVTLAVPVGSTRATVQALGANDAVLATVNFTFTVLQGQTVTAVPAGGGTTGTTGNTTGGTTGNTTGGTTGNTTGGTTGNTSGGTSGNTSGSTTGNTTSGTTGNTTPGTQARLEVTPDPLTVQQGLTATVVARFFPANSTNSTVVTAATSGIFSNPSVPGGETRFRYTPAGTVDTTGGTGGAAAAGEQITLTVFYTPPGGTTINDTVRITVGTAAQATQIVSARVGSLAPGATLRLPGAVAANNALNVDFPVFVVTTAANGTQAIGTIGTAPGNYRVTSASATAVSLTTKVAFPNVTFVSGNLIAVGQPVSTTVTVDRIADPANGIAGGVVATIPVTVADTTMPAANQITLTPLTPLVTNVGATTSYTVNLNYVDGTTQDVTAIYRVASSNTALLRVEQLVDFDGNAGTTEDILFAGSVSALAVGTPTYATVTDTGTDGAQFGLSPGNDLNDTINFVMTPQTRNTTINP